uniref:non-specific serine/threonine protein kinase n=1 Tax=Arcella intermedia TaxID=1963864 RepID=A0A6B2L314_9EUKA
MDTLGDGQYSVVKLGVSKGSGEEVALKFVHKNQTEPNELVNEVELMREVATHPRFVQLKDVYEDEKHYVLVMELVRGGELFDKIAELNNYTEEQVAKLVCQIAEALAYLHSKKIVHRDLKPENLLFVDEEITKLKICDFGIAEKIPEKGYLTEIIGTESYMAPEVELGKPYGLSSDLYGLGILMYIMLCGYPPFEPENGIIDLEFPVEEWSDISGSVKDLITQLLDKDPEKRPSAEEVCRHPWVSGEKASKGNLPETISTMKLFNHFRASGNFGSIRSAKNNKAALWSLIGDKIASKKKKKMKGSDAPTKGDSKEKLEKGDKLNSSKKPKKESAVSPRPSVVKTPDKEKKQPPDSEKKKDIRTDSIRVLSPRSTSGSQVPVTKVPKAEPDLRNTVYEMNPPEGDETVALLECKIVSLSNINCALQSQVDEVNAAYTRMKLERDELARELEAIKLELELLKLKEKKKEKKEKK